MGKTLVWVKRLLMGAGATLALAWLLLVLYAFTGPGQISAVFVNGDVLTISDGVAEALYVEDGEIKAVGTTAEVLAAAPENVDQFDLKGGALLPGLVEPHTHPIATAMLGKTVDVSGFSHASRAEIFKTLEQAADSYSPNGWLIAFGWDPLLVDDLEPPTLAELDLLSPEKPLLILTQMMHDAYANSAALKAAGIDKYSLAPLGGEFVKDLDGELTGTVREVSAINVLFAAVPKPPRLAVTLLTQLQLQKYAAAGYSSIGVLGPVGRVDQPLQLLEQLLANHYAPLRGQTWALPHQLDAQSSPAGDDRYALRGVKFWMDGSPFAGGAAFEEPYENTRLVRDRLGLPRDHMAHLNHHDEDFKAQFADYHKRGFSVAVHVQGERAVEQVLDAAESVLGRQPQTHQGHRLEHNALITPPQIARAKRLGFNLSFFVDHVWFYGHAIPDLVGDRTYRYMPLAISTKLGNRISLHGDHPATPIAPFRTLKTATTRMSRVGTGKIAKRQAISIQQALKAMTLDAAWQLGLADKTGSLEVGKAADLLWLDKNPLTTPATELDQLQVKASWLEGRRFDPSWNSRANARLLLDLLW